MPIFSQIGQRAQIAQIWAKCAKTRKIGLNFKNCAKITKFGTQVYSGMPVSNVKPKIAKKMFLPNFGLKWAKCAKTRKLAQKCV